MALPIPDPDSRAAKWAEIHIRAARVATLMRALDEEQAQIAVLIGELAKGEG